MSVRVRIRTPVGPLAVVGTQHGVTHVYFEGVAGSTSVLPDAEKLKDNLPPTDIPGPVRQAVAQLEQYMAGEPVQFSFQMDYSGTPFQLRVWQHLLTIPAGETRTYGQVAYALGQPTAARAVGGAVGRNPISIAIPCHRVVGADGRGGGYGGGMRAKTFLLQIEGVRLRNAGEAQSN